MQAVRSGRLHAVVIGMDGCDIFFDHIRIEQDGDILLVKVARSTLSASLRQHRLLVRRRGRVSQLRQWTRCDGRR